MSEAGHASRTFSEENSCLVMVAITPDTTHYYYKTSIWNIFYDDEVSSLKRKYSKAGLRKKCIKTEMSTYFFWGFLPLQTVAKKNIVL